MKKLFLLLVLALGFTGYTANASHQSAADIYYDYISPLKYRVHLIIYRDCTGVGQGQYEYLSVYSESLGQTAVGGCSVQLDTTGSDPINGTGFEVGDVCGLATKCTNAGSIFNGYEEWHYAGIVDLPAVATDWKFQWTSCCRNPAIVNIPQNSMTVYALLNNVIRPINNSIRLSQKPIPYVCINVPYVYVNGPYDPDGDLINVKNAIPLDNGTGCNGGPDDPYTYITPYSLAVPLDCAGNSYSVSLTTGSASFTPTVNNAYVLGFRFYDITNTGDTVGMVMRDVQVNVEACSAPNPIVNFTNGYALANVVGGIYDTTGGVNTIVMCPGIPLSFDVSAYSTSGTNNLVGLSNNATACVGSTMTFTPPASSVLGTFNWIPPGNASNNTLVIEFDDSTCTVAQPIVLKAFIIVNLIVLPGVSGGGPYNFCPGGDSLQLLATGAPNMNIWNWTALPGTIGSPNFATPNNDSTKISPVGAPPGIMYLQVEGLPAISGCSNIDTVEINIYDSLILSAGPDKFVCSNEPVQISATVNNGSGTSLWTPALYLNAANVLTPMCTPLNSQQYYLQYTDPNGCKGSDTMNVVTTGIKPILNALSERDTVCPNIPFQLFANASAQPCGISQFQCNAGNPATYKQVGNGNFVNATFSPFYRTWMSGYRAQYIYKASELKAAGMVAGIIKGLTWDVVTNPTNTPLLQYRIKMGCTNLQEFSSANGFVAGLPTVFSAINYQPTLGINAMDFQGTTEFFWDGSSNVVVEICYSLPQFSGGMASEVKSEATGFSSSIANADMGAGCSLPSATALIAALRPNTKFMTCPVSMFNYTWTPATAFTNNTLQDPIVQAGITNTTTFTVNAVSSTNPNCTSSDVVTVSLDLSGSVDAIATPAHLCEPGLVNLTATPNATSPKYDCGEENVNCIAGTNMIQAGLGGLNAGVGPWSQGWYNGNKSQWMFTPAELIAFGLNVNSRIDSLAINVIFNSGTPFQNMQIKMGCSKAPNLTSLQSSLDFKTVYNTFTYVPVFGWNNFRFTEPFVWDGTSNLVIEFCHFNGSSNGNATDIAVHNTGGNVYETDAFSSDGGCDLPFAGTIQWTAQNTYRPDTRLFACQVAPKPFTYIWDNPLGATNSLYYYDSTKQGTLAYVPFNSTYQVSILNRNGCRRSDTVQVRIETHDITVSPTDTVICKGDKFVAYAYPTGTDANPTLTWYPATGLSCTNCTTPEVSPAVTTQYIVVRQDMFTCKDTATMDVLVNPGPTVLIKQGDSLLIPFNTSVDLDATGAYIYNWAPSWGLSTTNQPSTIITPQSPGMYYVYALDSNGCKNYDSIYIDINYRSPIFIPNAFTPNGDGSNDFFGITHLKFQKIQEFRVFDRFGNEVFSTNDAKGWNGTYRGKALDMDTYHYVIRLAYPDGFVDTYKGDVLLMR
jgi:gliding motility-associated-like protein